MSNCESLVSNINDKRILIIRDLANQTRLDTTVCITYYLIFPPPPLVFGIWHMEFVDGSRDGTCPIHRTWRV